MANGKAQENTTQVVIWTRVTINARTRELRILYKCVYTCMYIYIYVYQWYVPLMRTYMDERMDGSDRPGKKSCS